MTLFAALVLAQSTLPHTFTYTADWDHRSVTVAGAFNHWDKRAHPMVKEGRTWSLSLRLAPGKHPYKFVLDDQTWITDPKSQRDEDDGNGNVNSILILLPPDYAVPARRGDGVITSSAVEHVQESPLLNYDRGRLILTVYVRPEDVDNVRILDHVGNAIPMARVGGDEVIERWTGTVAWDRKSPIRYEFEIVDGDKSWRLGKYGIDSKAGFEIAPDALRVLETPRWVERTVAYQIFPDRFENGDRANDPSNVVPWDAQPTWYNVFGGDLRGVENRLDYLKSLHIGAVYFNPLNESPSNHRYDATDFYKVDPKLGTDADLARLGRRMREAGIRPIYDVSFNHSATNFGPFKDLIEKQQDSSYKDWFFVKSWPIEVKEDPPYVAWFNFPSMPKLNLANPDTRKYMLGIVDHWYATAPPGGWRLDVANEVEMDFWRELRTRVKKFDPDGWIVGEVWGDASPWLKGDQWDSAMNYRFREAVIRFLLDDQDAASGLERRLMEVYHSYPPQASRNMMNLLGSHDTPRILTVLGGRLDLAHLAAVLQFTWVGSPCIYYGDEVGMNGGPDPDNRRGMRWDLVTDTNPTLRLYRQLAALRTRSLALAEGDPTFHLVDDEKKVVVYSRTHGDESVLVAINQSGVPASVEIKLPKPLQKVALVDYLKHEPVIQNDHRVRLHLEPHRGVIVVDPSKAPPRTPSALLHSQSYPKEYLG